MPLAHCSFGTTTDRIDLLDLTGIHVGDWTPVAGAVDAVFSSSALADYRTLKYYREVTTEETLEFTVKKSSQDDVIVAIQNLRRMCRAAMDYWVESWQDDPVYLAVQASCETNRRYTIIHSAAVPEDNNPFGQPFLQQGNRTIMIQVLGLERGPWLDAAPGTATCIEACAPENYYCWPSHLLFDASADDVNCGRGWGSIDDLPPAPGFTVEAWVRADGWGQSNLGIIASKIDVSTGWSFNIDSAHGLVGYIDLVTQDAISYSGTDEFTPDGLWHHVAMTFSPIGAGWGNNGYIRLWIDGAEVASYAAQLQGQGAYNTDAAIDFLIGDNVGSSNCWDGAIGWVNIGIQPWWQDDFTPKARCEIPAGTYYQGLGIISEGIWITEGTGATTINRITPGTGDGTITGATWDCDCVLSYGRMCGDLDQCWPAHYDFDGVSDFIYCGDYAEIEDLPDDGHQFTVEAWIKADGWGEGNNGFICQKGNVGPDDGWIFSLDNTEGLYFWVHGGGGGADGEASSGLDEFSLGSWVHVVGTVTPTGGVNATLNLAVGGTWVASYATHVNKTGAYQQDSGDALWIGNRSGLDKTFDGSIGWVRLSTNIRYTVGVDFTPPLRCALPDVDANTAGIWIYEGYGPFTWNLAVAESAILSSSDRWDCDCDYEVDQSTSCLVQPYIANYLKTSGLTDIYFTDAGGPFWSGNLLHTPLPHILLPTIPAVGDAVYFGVDTTLLDSGPFCNLVFDIMTAQTDLTGQWEFYDLTSNSFLTLSGSGMGPQDNTNADGLMTGETFDTLDIKSVHWMQEPDAPENWGPIDLPTASGDATAPAVTGYWIRWVVTAIGGSPTPPWQQNRSIYTISWPYVEIQDEDVPGDIAANLALELFNESDHDGGVSDPLLFTTRLIAGLRSLERGQDFVAYLNASNEQNPPFITVTANPAPGGGGTVNFSPSNFGPTGQICAWTNVTGGDGDWGVEWAFDADESYQFFGEYRAFARVRQYTGNTGDVSFALGVGYGSSGATQTYAVTDYVPTGSTGGLFDMIDLGRVVIPPTDLIKLSENTEITIRLYAKSANGTEDINICDVILMPVDEWAGDFVGMPSPEQLSGNRSMAVTLWGGKGRYFYMDSITYPKFDLRAMALLRSTGNFDGLSEIRANRPAILQANKDQRLWFLSVTHITSRIETACSVQVYSQAHYLSMRGDR